MLQTITAKTVKVTLVVNPAEIAALSVPNGTSITQVCVEVAGRQITVALNAKKLRKVISTINEFGDSAVVILQGKLEQDPSTKADILAEAGLTVQQRVAKSEQAAA